jgi:hypothetical protein
MDFTLNQEEYEALVALANVGAVTPEQRRSLDAWLRLIETKNNVVRHQLWVQWQEVDTPLPPNTRFPSTWPPTQRGYIEFISRVITREDVDVLLAAKARNPVTVLVTPDPGASLGWTPVDAFFGV